MAEKETEETEEPQDLENIILKLTEDYSKLLNNKEQQELNGKFLNILHSIVIGMNEIYIMLQTLQVMEKLKAVTELTESFTTPLKEADNKESNKTSGITYTKMYS